VERSDPAFAGGEIIMRLTTLISAVLVLSLSGLLFAREWIEFASREAQVRAAVIHLGSSSPTLYHYIVRFAAADSAEN